MPMPTSALWIMLQSLAPSPIASVILFSSRLISRTTAPFCLGVTRQHTTVLQILEICTKLFSYSGSRAHSKHLPSMTRPSNMRPWALACFAFSAIFLSWRMKSCFWKTSWNEKSEDVSCGRSTLTSASRRPVAMPMLMAVSVLSPVSIQTLMPACVIRAMASPTPSCNRSSIPVMPCISRFVSISSATASNFSCRLVVAQEASSNFFNHGSSSTWLSSRPARQSVRRPSSANSLRTSSKRPISADFWFFNRAKITESAPLV
mmetsp:Transcript_3652/g.11445  ORF Transcript_3652/g.11445 Transcript_3652/m.11445 type:complete len:261 (+) Transcript_3652:980-1762(+)